MGSKTLTKFLALVMLGTAGVAFGQDPAYGPPPTADTTPGWHRFSNLPAPPNATNATQPDPAMVAPQGDPTGTMIPSQITIPAGTFITVRVDQFLSSNKNQKGDGFSATLAKPLVANGLVIARRGQTLGGQVTEAVKAGRVKGVSRLAVQLNSLTLADGQQLPIESTLDSFKGPTSNGRDATAMAATTGTGAAIGAAAAGGVGAGIGAGAGLIASTIGVLVTRGRPTEIFPESQLTFRLAKPVTFSTDKAPEAFVAVNSPAAAQPPTRMQGSPPPYEGGYPPPPPPYYYPPVYPYYWGPAFSFYYGPAFYGYHGFYGRGFGFRR
jgi:hypothetical protein